MSTVTTNIFSYALHSNCGLEFFERPSYIISYLPTPPLGQDMTQGHFLSRV